MRNYQKELEAVLTGLETKPSLLLHACCAPCASYVLEYLSQYFEITVFFYNPNVSPLGEFEKRRDEAQRLAELMGVAFISPSWDNGDFEQAVTGLWNEPEGGGRCHSCFALRLEKTAAFAASQGFSYFATTLTISPQKNAALLNEIGEAAALKFGAAHLPSDFKKKEGYKRSTQLSKEFNLYRQNFCGCIYSKGT